MHPLLELLFLRWRSIVREPSQLFWIFIFPLVASVVLGVAFRDQGGAALAVAVVEGPRSAETSSGLGQVQGLQIQNASLTDGQAMLRHGKVTLVVVPGEVPQLLFDPSRPESQTARLLITDALERMRGRKDLVRIEEVRMERPGSRYIDFLIPGLLGYGMLASTVWAFGYAIAQMRAGKLLKRLAASPMKRWHFLSSFVAARGLLALVEMAVVLGFGWLVFDVGSEAGVLPVVAFALLGVFAFSGLSLLVASRVENAETAGGLGNLMTVPMMVLSGVFFSTSRFPEWLQPALQILPLTALNDGLRALMMEGADLTRLAPLVGTLLAWGILSFGVALRLFRWT